MTTLREVAQGLHDKIDDLNVQTDFNLALCIICNAGSYNGTEGIQHKEKCLLTALRKIISGS